MNPFRVIDRNTWPRRELFAEYQRFSSPSYTVSVKIKGEALRAYAGAQGESFFLLALYAIVRAANSVPQLRQRCLGDSVVEFATIDVLTPVLGPDEQFYHAWCVYEDSFPLFKRKALPRLEAAKRGMAEVLEDREDFLCASCVPWLHFESVSAAQSSFDQAIPILTWGKIRDGNIPFSVRLSHSFVDGLHVGRFFEQLEAGFTQPERLW